MNIKTNLLEEYVDFVDTTEKRNTKLWICIIRLVFIQIILMIIIFRYGYIYILIQVVIKSLCLFLFYSGILNEYSFIEGNK